MEKKNTGLIVFVIILLIAVLGLSGFIVYDKVVKKDSNTVRNSDKLKLEKIDSTKDIIYTKQQFKILNYTNDITESKIPQINIKSELIDEINKEILSVIKEKMKTSSFDSQYLYEEPTEENSSNYQNIYHVDYDYFLKDNILSLMVKYQHLGPAPMEPQYMIYNIDLEDNIRLLNSDLVKRLGYTVPQTRDEIISQIKNLYVDMANEFGVKWNPENLFGSENDDVEYYTTLYIETMSRFLALENDTQISQPMYIDNNGKLNVIIKFAAPGGTGQIIKNIKLYN